MSDFHLASNNNGHKALNVLVVDDDGFNQDLAVDFLQDLGHRGVVVDNGQQALDCIAQRDFDVVLMDIMMPVLDGLATLAAIRAKEKRSGKHLFVIMATGHAESRDKARLMQAGADGYLVKPIQFDELKTELKKVYLFS